MYIYTLKYNNILDKEGAKEIVLKALILAGGRGKGQLSSGLKGGVHLVKDPNVVGDLTKNMIGYNLVTKQTPPAGVKVDKVCESQKESTVTIWLLKFIYFSPHKQQPFLVKYLFADHDSYSIHIVFMVLFLLHMYVV